jgi:hypothetical protein
MMCDAAQGEKCWGVYYAGDDLVEFVFASSRGKAIYESEKYRDCGDWRQMRARRVPAMDGKEITRENIEAAGFFYLEE